MENRPLVGNPTRTSATTSVRAPSAPGFPPFPSPPPYSKEKIAGINRDFGRTYPQIGDFLQRLFSGERQNFTNEQLMNLISEKIIVEKAKRRKSLVNLTMYALQQRPES
jgi:hypothetical protein